MSWWKKLTGYTLFWPLVALALLLAFNLFFTPHFFRIEIKEGHFYGNLIDILKNGAPIMLLAIGMTLVIATKGIDLSVGSLVAISAGVVAMLLGGDLQGIPKHPLFVSMAIAVLVCVVAGMWNGMLVSRIGMQPIIATLILYVAGRGIAMVTTNALVVWLYVKPFALLGQGYVFGLPFSLYMVAVLLLLTILVTRRTALGLFIEAVGINPTAARFAGISAKNIILGVYAFSGFCAGVSGLIACSTVMSADGNNLGVGFELDAILAVVLGGTSLNGGKFHLLGSIVGALIIETLTVTIYAFNVPPQIAQVVKAMVVYIISLLQSPKFRSSVTQVFGRRELAA
ncbi:MAG TPA: ABC transporter permease [Rectinemataceae bacterium]|nr:ABC transporter permease [Rectinemataceae bacterium]